jgi:hypothetical protein
VAELKNYRDALAETVEFVKQSMAAGKTLAQIKADGLPEKWNSMGGGFMNSSRWIETIYNDAMKK